MSKKSNAAVLPVDSKEEEQKSVTFSPALKYAARQEKAVGKNTDPNWVKRDATFTLGHAPKTPTSVMGTIYSLAQQNPKWTGAELAAHIRMYPFPNRKRSHYLTGGIPPIGWAEDYINGAVSKGHLKMVVVAGTPADAPKEPKQEPVKTDAKK